VCPCIVCACMVCVCVFVCGCVCVCVCMYGVCMCVCVCVCMCVCMYVCVCVHVWCVYVRLCVCVCVHVWCVYVFVRIGMCVSVPFRNRLILRPGKKVWEIRPGVNWDKGAAAKWIYQQMKNEPYPIYVGDDVTDEDVFRVFRRQGLTVRVGRNPHSCAEFFIRDQRAIKTFLINTQKVIANAGQS